MITDYDLKALICKEHYRAELQLLDEGQSGCGCDLCQRFYKTLDLTRYGSRVTFYDDLVFIEEKKRQDTDRWSEGGQIFFCSGSAYGVTPNLRTIWLGKEGEILKALKENIILNNQFTGGILTMERESIEEGKDNGQPDIKGARYFRSRPTRAFQHREANVRRPSTGKRIALRKA